jgi:hypothetical protein
MVGATVTCRPASPEPCAEFRAEAIGPLRVAVLPRWPPKNRCDIQHV